MAPLRRGEEDSWRADFLSEISWSRGPGSNRRPTDYDHQARVAINVSNATAFGVEIPALGRADEVIELGAERMTPVPANGPQEGMLLRHGAFPDLLSGAS